MEVEKLDLPEHGPTDCDSTLVHSTCVPYFLSWCLRSAAVSRPQPNETEAKPRARKLLALRQVAQATNEVEASL